MIHASRLLRSGMSRIHAIDALKGLAILGVLLIHCATSRQKMEAVEALGYVQAVANGSVMLFLFCSGVLYRAGGKDSSMTSFWVYAKKRFVRLIVPYLALRIVYSLAWVVLVLAHPAITSVSLANLLRTPAPQLYFLPLLFGITLVAHACHGMKPGGARKIALLASFACVAGIVFWDGQFHGLHLGTILWGFVAYCFGILCAPVLTRSDWPRIPAFEWLGQASGTIYCYHLPFVLSPLLILLNRPSASWQMQTGLSLLAVAATAGLLAFAHHRLAKTKLRFVTM